MHLTEAETRHKDGERERSDSDKKLERKVWRSLSQVGRRTATVARIQPCKCDRLFNYS